jgi:hypothetical protein
VATCPAGHASASDDFCDVCGVLIGAAPSLAAPDAEAAGGGPGAGGPQTAAGTGQPGPQTGGAAAPDAPACPRCGVIQAGRFCEGCGYDFAAAPAPATPDPASAPASAAVPAQAQAASAPDTIVPAAPGAGQAWAAVVTADRAYYDSMQAAGGPDAAAIAFPAYCPQRRFRLDGAEIRIGRRSARSGISPEIDLSVAPADPGISRLHAVLLRAPDGSWTVLDPGSANGTVVNGTEIPPGQPVPLREGDRIHLGAWTELQLVREP